jgi:microcystin-dependent protein
MPFNIPNDPDTNYTDQAEPDSGDFKILAGSLYGVLNGLAVTPGTGMNVLIASGNAIVSGSLVQLASQQTGFIGAAGPKPRFDLVGININGQVTVTVGQSADNPVFPSIPANTTILASVYVPVGTSVITAPLLVDKRVQFDRGLIRSATGASSTYLSSRVDSDPNARFSVTADGGHAWGNGTGATDLTLYRSAAGQAHIGGGVELFNQVASIVAMLLKSAAGQSADLFQALASDGSTVLARITSDGTLSARNIIRGSGDPNAGLVPGSYGDLYQNLTGSPAALYIKETGATGSPSTGGWATLISGASSLPVGLLAPYAGSSAPSGWLLCNGQAVSRSTYASLFAVCGTSYGAGDGSTTFNVPDLRGRVPVGTDTMSTSAANRIPGLTSLGVGGGVSSIQLTAANLPSHTHAISAHSHVLSDAGIHTHNIDSHNHGGQTGLQDLTHTHTGNTADDGPAINAPNRWDGGASAGYLFDYGNPGGNIWVVTSADPQKYNEVTFHNISAGETQHHHSFTTGNPSVSLNHGHGIPGSGTLATVTGGGGHSHTLANNTVGLATDGGTGSSTSITTLPPYQSTTYIIKAA